MANYTIEIEDEIEFAETIALHNAMYTPYYGSIAGADSYFQYKLYNDPWLEATYIQKVSALVEASRSIDNLSFSGCKYESDQRLEFPRTVSIVPTNIEFATYEIALKLLDGVDPDTERDNLSVTSRGFGQVRVNYDRGFVPQYYLHGIPSQIAWNLLAPYLADSEEVIIRRGS